MKKSSSKPMLFEIIEFQIKTWIFLKGRGSNRTLYVNIEMWPLYMYGPAMIAEFNLRFTAESSGDISEAISGRWLLFYTQKINWWKGASIVVFMKIWKPVYWEQAAQSTSRKLSFEVFIFEILFNYSRSKLLRSKIISELHTVLHGNPSIGKTKLLQYNKCSRTSSCLQSTWSYMDHSHYLHVWSRDRLLSPWLPHYVVNELLYNTSKKSNGWGGLFIQWYEYVWFVHWGMATIPAVSNS